MPIPCEQKDIIIEIKAAVDSHTKRLHLGDLTLQGIKTSMDSMREKIDMILEQTMKTNGRVTKLERCLAAIKWIFIGGVAFSASQALGITEVILGAFK